MRLKICKHCSKEDQRLKQNLEKDPGYMCPRCEIDIYVAMYGTQRSNKCLEGYDDLAYYYDEILANSLESDKGTEYDGAFIE